MSVSFLSRLSHSHSHEGTMFCFSVHLSVNSQAIFLPFALVNNAAGVVCKHLLEALLSVLLCVYSGLIVICLVTLEDSDRACYLGCHTVLLGKGTQRGRRRLSPILRARDRTYRMCSALSVSPHGCGHTSTLLALWQGEWEGSGRNCSDSSRAPQLYLSPLAS